MPQKKGCNSKFKTTNSTDIRYQLAYLENMMLILVEKKRTYSRGKRREKKT